MNWFTYIPLVVLSAFLMANALAMYRAARNWALFLSASLGIVPPSEASPGQIFLPGPIQDVLVPPYGAVWFWLGLFSTTGSIIAGWFCLEWPAAVVGIITAWIAAKVARSIWPQPFSRMYAITFYECLEWRLAYSKKKGDTGRSDWLATLMAVMEQTPKLPTNLDDK